MKPIRIYGSWRAGWTLDEHTISCTQRPDGTFDSERSELGEMLYKLKYQYDRSQLHPIADITARFLREELLVFSYLKAIVPIPPSDMNRPFQPVFELAKCIGRLANLPVSCNYLRKVRKTIPLKNLEDPVCREEQLKGAMRVVDGRFRDQYILLFDDLYRSGQTLNAATNVLQSQGGVKKVFVLALTRTRKRR